MITRLYIHQIKSFVNFEAHFGPMHVLMGPNGAGKSAMLDVLSRVRKLIGGEGRVDAYFPPSIRTRGLGDPEASIRVELDVSGNGGTYRYTLAVEYEAMTGRSRIGTERLDFDGRPLFSAERGNVQLYRDDHTEGPSFSMDWTQSGVSFLQEGRDNTRLTWFRQRVGRTWVLRPNPFAMREESRAETARPASDLSDFADWYRHLVQARPDRALEAMGDLRRRIPAFRSLRFEEAGDGKILVADFEVGASRSVSFRFGALSEGQKVLIALYVALHALSGDADATLCIDEPENFLALPEVQPWLDAFYDRTEDENIQGLLVSHHPRVINQLAVEQGLWLDRDEGQGPTRVRPIESNDGAALSVSELVERGWVHG